MKSKVYAMFIAFVLNFTVMGLIVNVVYIAMTLLPDVTGCSTVEASALLSLSAAGTILGHLLFGPIISKYSPKVLSICGAAGVLVMFLTLAYSKSIYVIWVGMFIFGMVQPLFATLIAQTLLAKWLKTGRGFAITFLNGGSSLLAVPLTPLVTSFIASKGLSVLAVTGVIATIVIVICSLFFLRAPEVYGEEAIMPFWGKGETDKKGGKSKFASNETAMPFKCLLRLPVFYLVIALPFLWKLAHTFINGNYSLILQQMDLNTMQISYAVSAKSVANVVTLILFGFLCDRIGPKISMAIYMIAEMILSFGFVAGMFHGLSGGILIACLVSFGASNTSLPALLMPYFFGAEKSAKTIGITVAIANVANTIGAPLAAAIATATGGFEGALVVGGIILVVAFVIRQFVVSEKFIAHINELDAPYKSTN